MIKVSVICLAYNHEAYIRKALDGFVMQQTDFQFEVLVHDDASSDGTAAIIREYAARWPDIIRPVFETENQHAKGLRTGLDILGPMISGEYVALCEGDDYWTDPHKLSRQVAALEAHPEIDICAHRTKKVKNGRPHGYEGPGRRTRIIPAEEVIMGGGGLVATCSIMCRRDAYLSDTPMRKALFLDYTLQVQASLRGGMLYLGDCMSVYRRGVPNSWTTARRSIRKIDYYPAFIRMLEILDEWTEGRYSPVIRIRKARYTFHIIIGKLL